MDVASRKSATLDLQIGDDDASWCFSDAHSSRALRWEIKKQRTAIELKIANEIPTSCMKLVPDQHSAGVGRRANHDKPKTMVCRHLRDPRNQERCQITTTRNFLIGAASEDTASGDVLDCKLHGRETPSVPGHRFCRRQHAYHGKLYKTHDTK